MKEEHSIKDLNRINRIVYKKFLKKADDIQKEKMIKTLKEQLENLKMLLEMMENYNRH